MRSLTTAHLNSGSHRLRVVTSEGCGAGHGAKSLSAALDEMMISDLFYRNLANRQIKIMSSKFPTIFYI